MPDWMVVFPRQGGMMKYEEPLTMGEDRIFVPEVAVTPVVQTTTKSAKGKKSLHGCEEALAKKAVQLFWRFRSNELTFGGT